jgi:inosine-uridine nucleoside N-ribohydrolase
MKFREKCVVTVSECDKYIILDTQGGYEDVVALASALRLAQRYYKVVLGISCVAGRRKMDDCVRDALIAQQIAGTDVPVFKGISRKNSGSTQSLLLKSQFPSCIDLGTDFAELDSYELNEDKRKLVQEQSAVKFIQEAMSQYKS